MQTKAQEVVMVIADISGYTRFMLAHPKALSHSQMIIAELLHTLVAPAKHSNLRPTV